MTGKSSLTWRWSKFLNTCLPEQFIKVHKSYVVALNKIEKIDRDEIIAGTMRIPVGGNFKDDLEQQLIQGKILRREWDAI